MSVRKSAGGTLLDAVMVFVEDMILAIIFIRVLFLLLFYSVVFCFILMYCVFGKE